MVDIKSIGVRIKALREGLKLKQEEFVQPLGINQSSLSMIEKGKTNATLDILIQIINTYDTTLDYLLYGRGHTDGLMVEENQVPYLANRVITVDELKAIEEKWEARLKKYEDWIDTLIKKPEDGK